MIFAGLDVETTGTDINNGARLIQIGIAAIVEHQGRRRTIKIARDVRPEGGTTTFEPEAMKVNGFTLPRIDRADPQHLVDEAIYAELRCWGFNPFSPVLHAVGFNVGGFDVAFVKKELPKTASLFSYRSVDLTGIAVLYCMRAGISYDDLKRELHELAVRHIGCDDKHDALWDAEAALVALDFFRKASWSALQ